MRWAILLLLFVSFTTPLHAQDNLIANGDFEQHGGNTPAGFELGGAASYQYLGDQRRDMSSMGVALDSSKSAGSVTCVVSKIDSSKGRWFRFSFRGLPQDGFAVGNNDLAMKIEFFGQDGKTAYDAKAKPIYDLIEQERKDLDVNGVHHQHGAEVWRDYQLEFMLPFPQVDQVRLSIGFGHGEGRGSAASFYVDDMSLTRTPAPPTLATPAKPVAPAGKLLPIGGRWFYQAKDGETSAPGKFDASNADRLLYHDAAYTAPFAGNMTATLRKGDKDSAGHVVDQDQLLADNVTVEFNASELVIHSHNVPNHPTGRFPELGFGNPSYITEQNETYYLPLNPQENPKHFVTTTNNSNHALPMGPIGIAINGVVFFNPFDAGNQDATDLMDRCCGHPNQDGQYHYHKYPICVNSPWADEGQGHSSLIGFAFDGYPVYGPYEDKDVMAKDVKGEHALNDFNMHFDAERGWHYHVTPGKFPYLLGGYWGTEDPKDNQRPPRRGMGGPGGGQGPGGRQGMGPPRGGQDGPPPPPMNR